MRSRVLLLALSLLAPSLCFAADGLKVQSTARRSAPADLISLTFIVTDVVGGAEAATSAAQLRTRLEQSGLKIVGWKVGYQPGSPQTGRGAPTAGLEVTKTIAVVIAEPHEPDTILATLDRNGVKATTQPVAHSSRTAEILKELEATALKTAIERGAIRAEALGMKLGAPVDVSVVRGSAMITSSSAFGSNSVTTNIDPEALLASLPSDARDRMDQVQLTVTANVTFALRPRARALTPARAPAR